MSTGKLFEELGKLAEAGVEVQMLSLNTFRVGGFYKSGTVTVNLKDKTVEDRYHNVETFDEDSLVEKLVELNYYWWQTSKDRFQGWSQPDSAWVPFLLKHGLVQEKVSVSYQ